MRVLDQSALEDTFALTNLASEPTNWIVLLIDHALLHRNDGVIGNADVLWANFGTALGDVTHSKAMLFLSLLLTIAEHI